MHAVPTQYAEVESFGGLLRAYMEGRGWKQSELIQELQKLAAATGRHAPKQPLVSAWLYDVRPIALDHFVLVADLFKWPHDVRQIALELAVPIKVETRKIDAEPPAEG